MSDLQKFKNIKSSDARKVIPKECYILSLRKTFFWYVIDLVIFFLGMSFVFAGKSILTKLVGSLISGTATAFLFV